MHGSMREGGLVFFVVESKKDEGGREQEIMRDGGA